MFFTLLETDNKQILRRCAPQNDIATSPQGDGRQAYNPNFEGEREGHEGCLGGHGVPCPYTFRLLHPLWLNAFCLLFLPSSRDAMSAEADPPLAEIARAPTL
jgi:hypothetical protein